MAAMTRQQAAATLRPSVFLGILAYGGEVKFEWMMSVFQLIQRIPVNWQISAICWESLVNRGRNHLTREFLASKCDRLLWVDTDISFKPEAISSLLSRDLPVVCGICPKKTLKPQWVFNVDPRAESVMPQPDGLLEVMYAGTGIMLVQRTVFDRMRQAYPDIGYVSDCNEGSTETWDFWSTGVVRNEVNPKGRFLSEDWYFCERWRGVGGKIYMDTRCVADKHIGAYPFPATSEQLAEAMVYYEQVAAQKSAAV